VEGEVEKLLKTVKPDVVIHTVAAREPDPCEEDVTGAERINRDLPARISAALPDSSHLLHISTDYVFDGQQAPYSEEDPVCPLNVYGRTKAEAEPFVLAHPRGAVLRIPVLVGEGPGFIQQMVDALKSERPQEIDHVLIRHPTWIRDVADVCAWILKTEAIGIWHASSENGGTRYELTQRVAAALNLLSDHLRPSDTVVPRTAERPFNSKLSPSKLLNAGGPACRELEDILRGPGSLCLDI
jgi:dTDP-4-dehydrorhamnose reductase